MKRIVILICVCWLTVSGIAQPSSLAIATDKTSSLIFPFAIRHVDRGSQAVLAQPVKEAPNILLVKAAKKDFPETNLSVITEDGSIYTFQVCYNLNPLPAIYYLSQNRNTPISAYANAILDNSKSIRGIKDKKWDIKAEIRGIYIRNDVIYYQLALKNNSPVDYDIELIRFYTRDKKASKRSAIQENDQQPLHVAGNTSQVKAFTNSVMVFALPKFTIPDKKYLVVQIMEKNGGRHLQMKIKNNKIMKATVLPDLR